jgi:D-sedoheptulose 7-phosphate isomerase
MSQNLRDSVLQQFSSYLEGLEALTPWSDVIRPILERLHLVAQQEARVLISFDRSLEMKARHFWQELLGFYRSRRSPISAYLLFGDHVTYKFSGPDVSGVDSDLCVHFGQRSSNPFRDAKNLLIISFDGLGYQVSEDQIQLGDFGLLSFILHLLCEVYEPCFTTEILLCSLDEAKQAALKTIDMLSHSDTLERVQQLLTDRIIDKGGFIALAGNGGSACDVYDLGKDVPGLFLPESGYVTCVSNDIGYEHVFSRAIEALKPGKDIFMGISTSGKSANILEASKQAKSRHIDVLFLGGESISPISEVSDITIHVSSNKTNRIQEQHSLALIGIGNWLTKAL